MKTWLDGLSIRACILLFGLLLLLPFVGVLVWLLADDVRQARDSAYAQVRVLASSSATQLQLLLDDAEASLALVAARPQVQALDPDHCDRAGSELVLLHPGFLALDVRDAQGRLVCSSMKGPPLPMTESELRWFDKALHSEGFMSSDVVTGRRTGRKMVALSVPIRNGAGDAIGVAALAIDLLALNQKQFALLRDSALVTVVDPLRAVVLRSADAASFIGTRPSPGEPDPAAGRREGTLDAQGRDGVQRLFAFVTLPGIEWRVSASLPRDEVFAPYRETVQRAAVITAALLLLTCALALRLSAAIVGPIERLKQAAARVAAGDQGVRAPLAGPPDVRMLAQQINLMLDGKTRSDARLRGIFESTVDAIVTADESQRIVQVNPAAAKMFGCGVDDMLGAPLDRFIPARHRQQHRSDVTGFGARESVARHMGATREVMALRFDGQEFPIEASISQAHVGGQLLYTVIHRDISERKRAHEAVAASRRQLQAALSSMTDAVLITSADGGFLEFNQAFAEFHRFKDREACPRALDAYTGLLEVIGPAGEVLALQDWPARRALRGESMVDAEYRLRRKDIGVSWIGNFSFAPVRTDAGLIVGAVVVGRDVTALKAAQVDLEASHAALQHFIARQDRVQEEERMRIARELHDDLQQTQAAIRIDLSELSRHVDAASPPVSLLLGELDNLAAQAVLSTRRIVEDLRPRMLEDLGLVPALQALASQFMQRTAIDCSVEAAEPVGDAIADRPDLATCLYRVTQEALNNVAKHAQASRVRIQLLQPMPSRLVLRVFDNGCGMPQQGRRRPDSFGILGMQERVRAQGGSLQIGPAAAGGTLLEALMPLGSEAAADGGGAWAIAPGALHGAAGAALREVLPDAGRSAEDPVPLPRLLGHTARQTLQSVIDALECPVAVLDGLGVVRYVNRAWTGFAERHGDAGPEAVGPGADYLEVCRRSAMNDASVLPVLQGLSDLLEGRATQFVCEYPCHTPTLQRWFRMHAAPMSNGDVLITHLLARQQEVPGGEPAH